MSRKPNPYRLVVQQNHVEPQIMRGTHKDGSPILLLHVQLTEDEPIPLQSFAFNFNSVEELLAFLQPLLDKAAELWPNNPWMQEYMRSE